MGLLRLYVAMWAAIILLPNRAILVASQRAGRLIDGPVVLAALFLFSNFIVFALSQRLLSLCLELLHQLGVGAGGRWACWRCGGQRQWLFAAHIL